ncbi:Ankyrin repeat-containing domain [Phytophthora cactorum]|nr:Ankyrin repeat-containing domain [Phytophthora cactorum]
MPSLTPEEIREFGNTIHPRGMTRNTALSEGFYGGLRAKNFKWLTANCDAPSSTEVMDRAAANGQYWNLIWFHNNRFEGCTAAAMDGAASNGHFFSLEWLHLNCDEGCTTGAMDGAASNGHLKVVIWLHKNRPEGCTAAAMDGAASNGHLKLSSGCTRIVLKAAPLLRWRAGCSTAAMDSAAGQGYLGAVKWLKENRSEGCSPAAMINAASKGYLDVVQYLLTNVDQQATNAAISAAAENGHLLNPVSPMQLYAQAKWTFWVVEFLLEHEDYRLAYEEETSKLLAEGRAALTQKVYHLFWVAFLVFRFIPQMLIEFFLPGKSPARVEMETRIRAEEEASIREKEEPRLRAEVAASIREDRQTKATIQAEEEEEMRARIRAEIQDSVEDKIRAEIRVGLLGDDLKKQI